MRLCGKNIPKKFCQCHQSLNLVRAAKTTKQTLRQRAESWNRLNKNGKPSLQAVNTSSDSFNNEPQVSEGEKKMKTRTRKRQWAWMAANKEKRRQKANAFCLASSYQTIVPELNKISSEKTMPLTNSREQKRRKKERKRVERKRQQHGREAHCKRRQGRRLRQAI